MRTFTFLLSFLLAAFSVSAQGQPTFTNVLNLLNAIRTEWSPAPDSVAGLNGMRLALYSNYDEGEFNSIAIYYAKEANIEDGYDADWNRNKKATGTHACVLAVEVSTSSGGSISFINEADYNGFIRQAFEYGLLQIEGDGDSQSYFVPNAQQAGGGVKRVSADVLFSDNLVSYMLTPKGKDSQGWYTADFGIDF